jgi:dinuclear metal center YbgI/SA1388 family protein
MKIRELIQYLEDFAPISLQENYDNSGLILGNSQNDISSVLISIDCTEAIVDEAIKLKANLIISHHPIIFFGLKKIIGRNYIEKTITKAIKNDIAIYACHTNLDNIYNGVNFKIAEKIGLNNVYILNPKTNYLKKLITFCPEEFSDKVRMALFNAGAGYIGNYDQCSFNASGYGTFRALENANPFVGNLLELHKEKEEKIEVIYPQFAENKIINALLQTHPYEEVAYDIIPLNNKFNKVGDGIIGEIEEIPTIEFLKKIKNIFKIPCLKHTDISFKKNIKKVALCGGAGYHLLDMAINANADIFLTSDIKYHQFFDAENKIIVADVGHYESEQFTKELLYDFIIKKKCNFAIYITKIDTNPIKYLI